MNPATPDTAQQETLATVPGVVLPEGTETPAPAAPSFAALMGTFRAEHDSEVEAAAALLIGVSTLSDYCEGKYLPRGVAIKRLAPLVGMPVDELERLIDAQREAQSRGESIATVAPIRTRKMRPAVLPPAGPGCAACRGEGRFRQMGTDQVVTCPQCGPAVGEGA